MTQPPPVDLFDPVFKANPYPTYARLRLEAPVHRVALPDINKLSYGAFLRLITAPYHRTINRWRKETLGLLDQAFWGRRVFDLGVGPEPVPLKKLSVERLSHAICITATDGGMRRRAADLGERIRAENGVVRAVKIIDDALEQGERPLSSRY